MTFVERVGCFQIRNRSLCVCIFRGIPDRIYSMMGDALVIACCFYFYSFWIINSDFAAIIGEMIKFMHQTYTSWQIEQIEEREYGRYGMGWIIDGI